MNGKMYVSKKLAYVLGGLSKRDEDPNQIRIYTSNVFCLQINPLKQEREDVPFDMKHWRLNTYKSIRSL